VAAAVDKWTTMTTTIPVPRVVPAAHEPSTALSSRNLRNRMTITVKLFKFCWNENRQLVIRRWIFSFFVLLCGRRRKRKEEGKEKKKEKKKLFPYLLPSYYSILLLSLFSLVD